MTTLSRYMKGCLKVLVVVQVVVMSKVIIDGEVGVGYTSIIVAFISTLGAVRSGVWPRGSIRVLIGVEVPSIVSTEAHGLGWRVVGP